MFCAEVALRNKYFIKVSRSIYDAWADPEIFVRGGWGGPDNVCGVVFVFFFFFFLGGGGAWGVS